jgi:hypothetical protein
MGLCTLRRFAAAFTLAAALAGLAGCGGGFQEGTYVATTLEADGTTIGPDEIAQLAEAGETVPAITFAGGQATMTDEDEAVPYTVDGKTVTMHIDDVTVTCTADGDTLTCVNGAETDIEKIILTRQ